MTKISFEVVSELSIYKADEKKKIQKISFFWHDPFSGYTDKPKKFKSLTAMLKSLLKCTLKHYFLWYSITHSVCGILLPK